jgi:hypothetical protein
MGDLIGWHEGMMFVDLPSALPLLYSLACWNSVEVNNVERRAEFEVIVRGRIICDPC